MTRQRFMTWVILLVMLTSIVLWVTTIGLFIVWLIFFPSNVREPVMWAGIFIVELPILGYTICTLCTKRWVERIDRFVNHKSDKI